MTTIPPDLQFPRAGQPDMVRSLQKDEYYKMHLHQQMHQTALFLLGSRRFSKYEREVATLSELLYYTLTTVLSQPTLGEEYCDIVQVASQHQELPTLSRRIKLVSLQTLLPYVFERALAVILRRANPVHFQESMEKWRNLAQFLFRFHLALFYMNGSFLELSKRFAGIRYIFTGQADQQQSRPSYFILGILIFVQQFISLYLYGRNMWKHYRKVNVEKGGTEDHADDIEESDDEEDSSRQEHGKCPLCLGRRSRTTATSCGHLFCWKCITSACTQQQGGDKCPICRQPIALQQLVCLYHYDRVQRMGKRSGSPH